MASTCDPALGSGNVGLAFGLVTAAGLSTTLGAGLAFVMPRSEGGKNLFLAASLGVATGVMLYVSFIEIFATKAVDAFEACVDAKFAYLYATVCFFGGVILTALFDCGLHLLEKAIGKRRGGKGSANSEDSAGTSATSVGLQNVAAGAGDVEGQAPESVLQASAEDAINGEDAINTEDERMEFHHAVGHDGYMVADLYEKHGQDAKALVRMGIFTGIALGFHNFPEGLATFVAVLDNPKVGASVAVAIGIHNIPEGICVAMPIYYATGSRWKAFFWATISGCTELIGALLGWIVLRKVFTQLVYGILFGIVSGMMVYISLAELLPTAHRYDPEDKVTTLSVFVGMVVMALSLVLFLF